MKDIHNDITAVVLVKNQEELLPRCLNSLLWCKHILVIDDDSSDKSPQIAVDLGADVIKRNLDFDFSGQRNFALGLVKTKWTLFVDADEFVPDELAREIGRVTENDEYEGYRLHRSDWFIGKKLKFGDPGSFNEVRLAKTGSGKFYNKVHEVWIIDGKIGNTSSALEHSPHKNINEMISALNFYSTLRAQELSKKQVKSNIFMILFFPFAKFMQNYIVRQGIRDGSHGLVNALLMSFYTYLVRSKLFLLNRE